MADAHPAAVYEFPEGGFAEGSTFKGPQAILALWSELAEQIADWRSTPERFFEAGDDVLVFVREEGRGRLSEVAFSADLAHVWTVVDGQVVRFRVFRDLAAAWRAVGTPPPQ